MCMSTKLTNYSLDKGKTQSIYNLRLITLTMTKFILPETRNIPLLASIILNGYGSIGVRSQGPWMVLDNGVSTQRNILLKSS